MLLGDDSAYVRELQRFKNLHVRVSMKGCDAKEFHAITGARHSAFELPFQALQSLIEEGVSCNACLSVSFSDTRSIESAKARLHHMWPGLLKSLEVERIKLFPKVKQRLVRQGLLAVDVLAKDARKAV